MAVNEDYQFDDITLLQAISDWQRGGDAKQNRRRGLRLKEVCASLPEHYRTCPLACFRQVSLETDSVWNLIGENRLTEKISSWTFNLEVAKAFKNGVPPHGQGYQGVIFYINPPPPNQVIINLRELYKNPVFRKAMESKKSAIIGFEEGAGRYSGLQDEVVLEIDSVTQEDIYSLGGHSSLFEHLVAQAAEFTYGRQATQEEMKKLLLIAEHVEPQVVGPKWLMPEATKRVLARTKPKAEALAESKISRSSQHKTKCP